MIRPKFIFSALSGLVLVTVLTFLAPVIVEKVIAQTGTKALSGYAWSSNIGWIQMQTGQSPVVVNSDGSFTGYGWSSNVGWLQFNPTGSYPAAPNHAVKIDFTQNPYKMSGWGRFLANGGGWDGWVNFDGVTYNPSTKKFAGYAWGADVVGWVDMSTVLADLGDTPCDPDTDPDCCPGGANCNPPCDPDTDPDCCPGGSNCDPDPTTKTLTVKVVGSGTVTGNSISCSTGNLGDCTAEVNKGNSITLSAEADGLATITWSESSCSVGSTCPVLMNESKTVTVTFSGTVTEEPDPFDIDINTCNGTLAGDCRLIVDCSGYDKCTGNLYYSLTSIRINNNMIDTEEGLTLSVLGGKPPYISFVFCKDKVSEASCSSSIPAGDKTSPWYFRALLSSFPVGGTNFTIRLSSQSGADKVVPIKVKYDNPAIVEGNKAAQ
ncbi:MAG: hypothetical protein K8Q91_02895 [Candidatus Vogelbacteria bacterium]|nr:hypothetical protein [Candidatus Vogelbacteria bacterium]